MFAIPASFAKFLNSVCPWLTCLDPIFYENCRILSNKIISNFSRNCILDSVLVIKAECTSWQCKSCNSKCLVRCVINWRWSFPMWRSGPIYRWHQQPRKHATERPRVRGLNRINRGQREDRSSRMDLWFRFFRREGWWEIGLLWRGRFMICIVMSCPLVGGTLDRSEYLDWIFSRSNISGYLGHLDSRMEKNWSFTSIYLTHVQCAASFERRVVHIGSW